VITEDQVTAMFAKANPMPSLDLLDPIEPLHLEHLEDRSERSWDMTELKTTEIQGVSPRRRLWLVPVLATAIAVMALGILLTRDDGVASPESVANAYMEAREILDAETAQALFAPDATVSEPGGFDLSEMPALFDWYRALNWNWTRGECTERSSGERGALVVCANEFESDWTRTLEHAPISADVQILVSESAIKTLIVTLDDEFGDVWGAFFTWIEENHPEDIDQMYGSNGPLLDDNSIALWEQHTEEFVGSEAEQE
jgi:hypothetical protein